MTDTKAYPWEAPHFGPLGHVAVLSARMEQIAGWIFGLLLDIDDATIGDVVASGMSVSQVLDRTKQLAGVRLSDTSPVDRWITEAKLAGQRRNELLHSAFRPTFDHATQRAALHRQRLRRGEWDVEADFDLEEIRRAAVQIMTANAAGTSAYITTERALLTGQ